VLRSARSPSSFSHGFARVAWPACCHQSSNAALACSFANATARKRSPSDRQALQFQKEIFEIDEPSTPSALADVPSGEGTADTPTFLPRPLHIHDRTYLRNAGTSPPLHAVDETGSARHAGASRTVCRAARLVCQEPFVCVASAMGTAAEPPEADGEDGLTGSRLVTGAAGCEIAPRVVRTAASIFARTLRAPRVRLTKERSTLAPVVRMRDFAVGPNTSSNATHATPMPPKTAPVVRLAHCENARSSAANIAPGTISRHIHVRLGQTTIDSRSCK